MRFDDSLKTVLAADAESEFGAQAAWRQLVDLAGRGRIAVDAEVLTRLRDLRDAVPTAVRAASARALAVATPDRALVGFFAEDEPVVSAPVLRLADLAAEDWLALLPRLSPAGRALLRGRRDLPSGVTRGLESFGVVDFTLSYDAPVPVADATPVDGEPVIAGPAIEPRGVAADAPRSPSPFTPLGEIAGRLPLVAEARRRAEEPGRFEIADIVARIDAFRRDRPAPATPSVAEKVRGFDFETDASAAIRWIDAAGRAALVGVSLTGAGEQGLVRVDAAIAGAVARRGRIEDGRLEIGGDGELSGSWRLTARPAFDRTSGRFTGYAGSAARAARHQRAERAAATDDLRELVHELRTPANAVAGFAEFIETQLLGPVPEVYRERATDIRARATDLLRAIDDLDTAARIEGGALELRPGEAAMGPLIDEVARSLRPLADARGAALSVRSDDAIAAVDERVAERLVARLAASLLAVAEAGETLAVVASSAGRDVVVAIDRPRVLAGRPAEALLALATGDEQAGAPLLGIGFTLRLIGNLVREVGGTLEIEPARLTLRLPTALSRSMGQAATS